MAVPLKPYFRLTEDGPVHLAWGSDPAIAACGLHAPAEAARFFHSRITCRECLRVIRAATAHLRPAPPAEAAAATEAAAADRLRDIT